MDKRLALDILQVQVAATQDKIVIKMAVPLEFATIERKREYKLPVKRKSLEKVTESVVKTNLLTY